MFRESLSAYRPKGSGNFNGPSDPSMYRHSVLSNGYAKKRPTWPWPRTIAKRVRGETMRKDKGMPKGKRRIKRQS